MHRWAALALTADGTLEGDWKALMAGDFGGSFGEAQGDAEDVTTAGAVSRKVTKTILAKGYGPTPGEGHCVA